MFTKKQLLMMILKNLLKASLAAAFAIAVIVFTGGQIGKISNSLVEQRTATFILEKRNETISRLAEDFKKIGGTDEKIKNAFPPVDNILDFVAALENLSVQNSIQETHSFGTPSETRDSIDYGINMSANIFSLINYLKSFEKLPYFTGVSGISLSAQGNGWEGNSLVSLKARVYTRANGN
jgi:hypothetical protein